MIKLDKNNFDIIKPLLKDINHGIPLVFSVIEGNNNGSIFVNCKSNPQCALICPESGFMYLASKDVEDGVIESVCNYIFNNILPTMEEKEMVLFTFSDSVRNKLDELLKDKGVIRIQRCMFNFNVDKYNLDSLKETLSPSYKLINMSEEDLANYCKRRKLSIVSSKMVGKMLLKDGQIISECVSIFVGGDQVEIDIYTHDDYRGKGFATITASAFIEKCLEKGLKPIWSCWPFRQESISLAIKLGFERKTDMDAHFWAENM